MNLHDIMWILVVLTVLLIIILSIIMIFIEPNRLVIKKYEMIVNKSINEYKIIVLSDTHFGKFYNQNKIGKIVELINNQNADIVLFCGDFIDNYKRDKNNLDITYLSNELSKIKANVGKYSVFGNHDYGGNAYKVYLDCMRAGGFTVLVDEVSYIQNKKISIIGLNDQLLGETEVNSIKINEGLFNIICCHEPATVKQLNLKNNSLMVSGHSHGGQVTLPFMKPILLPKKVEKYIKGRYEQCGVNKNITLIVSSGIGSTYLPIRLGNIPEIVEIILKN